MADKQVTVDVPEDRVPEFYLWFAAFLAAPAGSGPPRSGGPIGRGRGFGPPGWHAERAPWTADDVEQAGWLLGRLSPPARALFDALLADPGERHSGNELAARLKIEKGAHGLAGILAWPGRWCRKLGREFPITTTVREDGGTDYAIDAETAAVFTRAAASGAGASRRPPGPGPRRR